MPLAALVQFAAAALPSLLNRPLDLYWDQPQVPSLLGMAIDAAGVWWGVAMIAGALAVAVLLAVAVAGLVARFERALARPALARWSVGAAAVALGLMLLPLGPAEPFAHRAAAAIADQAAAAWRSHEALSGRSGADQALLAAPQPAPVPLPGLAGSDVYLVFFESYGTTVFDDPRHAPVLAPALARFAAATAAAGYHLRTVRMLSPTFGGGSWLAHGTIDSGIKLDQLRYRLLMRTGRRTLAGYLAAAGYRTIDVMPGMKAPWPEGGFWGFDRIYEAVDLGYPGPAFGWAAIPDQFTLARLDALRAEAAGAGRPLFAQIILVSSHTPFHPVPPYLADWGDIGRLRSLDAAQWPALGRPPDWAHLDQPYRDSVAYDLETLAGWLARLPGHALVIILGDHQPPGMVTGAGEAWTVPVHVLSRDAALLQPFAALGYVEGVRPPSAGAPVRGMESFLGDFLAGFGKPSPGVGVGVGVGAVAGHPLP